MFESATESAVERVRSLTADLAASDGGTDDAERIDLLRALEELKCAAAGAQATVTAAFDASQRARQAAAGAPAARQGAGVAAQVALARRTSPARAQQLVGFAAVVRREMPCTDAALRHGRITERAAISLVQETACVALAERAEVDRRIAGDLDRVELMSERQIVDRARVLVAELDPAAVAERQRRAESERMVSARPAPDTMMWLSALMPVKDGVAVWASLSREADRVRAEGDGRSRGQIMSDSLRDRVLGGGGASGVRSTPALMIDVVVPDSVLLGDDAGCGWVQDYGPVPGRLLRDWIAANAEQGVEQWVRRLYASPRSGQLVAMDSRARLFDGNLATYLRLRDQTCRTPYCNAGIRHLDHVERKVDGGATSATNGQGLCAACNQAKEALGWKARPRPGPDGEHLVEIVTPTGHVYLSHPPRWRVEERGLRVDIFRPAVA